MRKESPLVRSLVSFIGIDYYLLKRSGEDNIDKFWLSGFLLMLIMIISCFSVYYAFDMMFHKWYAEILLSLFFSLTFLNIYLLLLQTFSKETLPAGYKQGFWTTSNLARVGFIVMISFLLAQPLRIFCLSEKLDQDIAAYRVELLLQFKHRITALDSVDTKRLAYRMAQLEVMDDSPIRNAMMESYRSELDAIKAQISTDQEMAANRIAASDFFLQRIRIVGRYGLSWWVCLVVMMIYGLPVILIYSISGNSRYYLEKKQLDHDLVRSRYEAFKSAYQAAFTRDYGLIISFSEPYIDAPFNWSLKSQPDYGDVQAFLDDIS